MNKDIVDEQITQKKEEIPAVVKVIDTTVIDKMNKQYFKSAIKVDSDKANVLEI